MRNKLVAALGLVVVSAGMAHAQFDAYTLTPVRIGNQGFTGSLGLDFNVNTSIQILRLGAFDSSNNGIAGSLFTAIFNRNTQTIVAGLGPVTLSSADTLEDNYRWENLVAPVTLTPGQYSVVSWGYTATDRNGNVGIGGIGGIGFNPPPTPNDGIGLISFVGFGRFSAAPGVFPTTVDTGPFNRYAAGTFTFRQLQITSAAPEPGAGILLAAGLMAVTGVVARRKRN